MPENSVSIAANLITEDDALRRGLSDQVAERGFPFHQRSIAEIFTVELEQIKDGKHDVMAPAALAKRLLTR